jgi:hypothetical protein
LRRSFAGVFSKPSLDVQPCHSGAQARDPATGNTSTSGHRYRLASPPRLPQHFSGHGQRHRDRSGCFPQRHDANLQLDPTDFAAYPWQSTSNSSCKRVTIFGGAPASNTARVAPAIAE